jgi:hypothetical protein
VKARDVLLVIALILGAWGVVAFLVIAGLFVADHL